MGSSSPWLNRSSPVCSMYWMPLLFRIRPCSCWALTTGFRVPQFRRCLPIIRRPSGATCTSMAMSPPALDSSRVHSRCPLSITMVENGMISFWNSPIRPVICQGSEYRIQSTASPYPNKDSDQITHHNHVVDWLNRQQPLFFLHSNAMVFPI